MVQVKGGRVSSAAAPAAASAAARLAWVDNLKVAIIAGVVVHAAMAYLIDADWYYMERTTSQLWGALVSLPGLLAEGSTAHNDMVPGTPSRPTAP